MIGRSSLIQAGLPTALLLAATSGGCLAGGARNGAPRMIAKIRGRSGTKQGPLLMGDDFAREMKAKLRGAEPATKDCPLAKRLAARRAPKADAWRFPAVPKVARGQVSVRPFPSGCRTAAIGTGPHRARVVKGDRGTFDALSAAGTGQYTYSVNSPCITYHAKSDGWISLEFVILLSGHVEVETGENGKAGVEIGLYAAHCWPKQEGKYWQQSLFSHDTDTRSSFKSIPAPHRAVFPVKKGVKYSFGAGLTTQAWARDGAAAGCRVWGRLAHVTIRPVLKPPDALPYR